MPAPIALFVYNRHEHTRQTVESLQRNALSPLSDLFVFADGAREKDNPEDIRLVREYIRSIRGFRSVKIIERDHNAGLARSIIDGVSHVIAKAGQVIVLEDDMVCSLFFLKYMNDSLELYKKDDRVISIHGYIYPVTTLLPETFFLMGADCWGWATWKRGWDLFETDGQKLLSEIKRRKLGKRFDFDHTFPYTKMLDQQIKGKNDSWAIRWYASAFLAGKLTLYPGQSLVHNIGSFGTHCKTMDQFKVNLSDHPLSVGGIAVEENQIAKESVKNFFVSNKGGWRKIFSVFQKK